MNKKLCIRAMSRFLAGLLLVAGLLFIPAGTWNYPQGWLLIGILFDPILIARFQPALLIEKFAVACYTD